MGGNWQMATAVGGTHPTRMHSCFQLRSVKICTILTFKLKCVCTFGDLFLGYDFGIYISSVYFYSVNK